METVTCVSGLKGWRSNLQENYLDFEEFRVYCEACKIHKRLMYDTPKKAWDENPLVEGSVNSDDFRRVFLDQTGESVPWEDLFIIGGTLDDSDKLRDYPWYEVRVRKSGMNFLCAQLADDISGCYSSLVEYFENLSELDFLRVDDRLKRYSEEDGYYHV